MQSNYFDKYINNKILGSFILCNQDLIAVGNIHDIRVLENFWSDLLNSSEFVLDYIKQNDTSLNIKIKNCLFKGPNCRLSYILDYNKKNYLIIIESDSDYIFGIYIKKGFGYSGSKKEDDQCFLFSANLSKI